MGGFVSVGVAADSIVRAAAIPIMRVNYAISIIRFYLLLFSYYRKPAFSIQIISSKLLLLPFSLFSLSNPNPNT